MIFYNFEADLGRASSRPLLGATVAPNLVAWISKEI